jgi:holliday junction DNA helicase RuvA
MLAFLRGIFVNKAPSRVFIDVNGVGYDVQISLNTYEAISQQDKGMLYTHLQITENAQTLYGFFDLLEKEMFLNLISISGVGASTARMMLSGMRPNEIAKFIMAGSVNDLIRIKGIGKKTAELIIVGLRDKVGGLIGETQPNNFAKPSNPLEFDAINALVALGIGKPIAEKAVKKVFVAEQEITLQDLIKQALKNL